MPDHLKMDKLHFHNSEKRRRSSASSGSGASHKPLEIHVNADTVTGPGAEPPATTPTPVTPASVKRVVPGGYFEFWWRHVPTGDGDNFRQLCTFGSPSGGGASRHAVSLPAGHGRAWGGGSDRFAIHETESPSSPALAEVRYDRSRHGTQHQSFWTITFGGAVAGAGGGGGGTTQDGHGDGDGDGRSSSSSSSIDTAQFAVYLGSSHADGAASFRVVFPGNDDGGSGPYNYEDEFEWRWSRARSRWELARLTFGAAVAPGPRKSVDDALAYTRREGLEVLAATDGRYVQSVSMSGAAARGALGDRWALVAVAALLALESYGEVLVPKKPPPQLNPADPMSPNYMWR